MGRTLSSENPVEYFDRTAARFTARYETDPAFYERRVVWLRAIERALVGLPTDVLCLDIGCGDGSLSRFLASQNRLVIGLDQSEEMLELARRRAGEEDLGRCAIYRCASLPLDRGLESEYEGRAGLIVCSSVLEYVTDPAAVLEQCHRLLMPGGTLLVSVPNRDSVYRITQHAVRSVLRVSDSYLRHQRHQYSAAEAGALLRSLGYRVMDVVFFALPFHRYVVRVVRGYRGRRLATMVLFAAQKPGGPAHAEVLGNRPEETFLEAKKP